jgi:hypothetical protein
MSTRHRSLRRHARSVMPVGTKGIGELAQILD